MQQICIEAYAFEELGDKAKEKARQWWREGGLDYEWWDCLYGDFVAVGSILGIEIRQINDPPYPSIFFSGFCSQGDGACFGGDYSYSRMAHTKIRSYAPQDEELHTIADDLLGIQKANGYLLSASTKHRGNYSHSGCMEVSVCRNDLDVSADTEEELTRLLRLFADWMYDRLEKEYYWLISDESVDSTIIANEYLFAADGSRSVVL